MDNSVHSANIRRRRRSHDPIGDDELPTGEGHHQATRTPPAPRASRAALAYLVIGSFYMIVGILVHLRMNSYPSPKTAANSGPDEFREENARKHLEFLTGLGPRVSGSEANIKAEEYILKTVNSIKRESKSHMKFDIDRQVANGSFTLDFINVGIGEFTSVYHGLSNVVVKVTHATPAHHSVLINCHYDTVIDSPGAGDDAASCCVMLEILRALSQTDKPLMHNIIFLFNGAEENILQTSHGFITQHRWASSIKAFVNLDSAGAGGWEIVFQTGPEHPWLIKAYIESSPYPHASVVGQEIFQTGLIPSDTDYRIFRDYGKIPGIDIAHIKNGYVYHTKNDQAKFIPPGCMQRGGENVKALILTLATSTKLIDPGEDKHGSMVFFDFLGFFIVAYPQRLATLLNWITFVYVYVAFVKRQIRGRASGVGGVVKPMLWVVLAMLVTWVITLVVPVAMALTLTICGRSLAYYTHTLNIVWLFMLPSVTGALTFHLFLKKKVFKGIHATSMVIMLQDANLMLWSVVLAIMTGYNLMSSFLPLLCILWPAFFYTLMDILGIKPTSLMANLLASAGPGVYAVYFSYTLLMFIIPIMGRVGMEAYPDFLVAALSALPITVCLPYLIGFVYTHNRVGRVITTTVAVIMLGFCAVIFTPAGFPYSSNGLDASPQRVMLVHFDRRFHSIDGHVNRQDANIWYKPLDHHGGKMLDLHSPGVLSLAKRASCDGVYCGRPYLYPLLKLVKPSKTYDFPASELNVKRVDVQLKQRVAVGEREARLTFTMSGPSHVTIFISEFAKVRVKEWTFGEFYPVEIHTLPLMHEPTFFIYYSHADPSNTTWEFSLDIQVEEGTNLDRDLIKMGFAGHHLHGPNQVTQDLKDLEKQLPSWMCAVRWSATYDEYIF